MITCLADWAAILPNSSVSHFDAEAVSELGFRIHFVGFFQRNLHVLVGDVFHDCLELENLDFALFLVVSHFHIVIRAPFFSGCRFHSLFQSLDEDIPVEALFTAHLVDDSFLALKS